MPGLSDSEDPERDIAAAADRVGAVVRTLEIDGSGWRWRCVWRRIEVGAWNDMDGVAVVADIGPWDEWVGLRDHPADPSPGEALEWVAGALEPWLADPDNAERIAARVLRQAEEHGADGGPRP